MMPRLREWLEIRIGADELVRSQLTDYRVPKNINIFYTLGIVALAAFIFQAFTGILLMFYYIPDDKDAFQSIQFIMNHVPYGWLFRLMHVMGANLMVVGAGSWWARCRRQGPGRNGLWWDESRRRRANRLVTEGPEPYQDNCYISAILLRAFGSLICASYQPKL